jgi:signal transduction histidine kinase
MDITKKIAQNVMIALLVLVVTILHYSSDHGGLSEHISHRELYFIPILLSSLWFGLKYGLATSLAISLIYAPQVFGHSEAQGNLWPVVFQIMVFILVALMVGFLVERSRRQQARLYAIEKAAALNRAATAVGYEMKHLHSALKSVADQTARLEGEALSQKLEKEVLRLEQLVDILSSFTTSRSLQLFSYDLNDIIRERIKYHRAVARKNGVSFTTDLDAEGCPSRVDVETIGRVFDRIIQNALEVSAPGKAIHIHSTRKSDRCEVRITDEGPGIKPEHLPQMFKPFFTTKERGDGLALSSSQKLLRDMGGEIQVSSEYGKGAMFTVTVPREYSGRSLALDASN